jgi:tetratricopeptide (TPR) repeat protein
MQMCNEALDRESLKVRDRAATYVNRGILYMRAGNFERALSDYREGLALRPEMLEAKVNIGAALYGLRRYDEAMEALNEGLKTDSIEARAVGLYNRALIWEHRGDVKAAYFDYKEALELNPTFVQAAKQLERFTVTEVGS